VRNLNFSYGDTPVLKGIDMEIPAGSFIGLVGRVGSGKTTLLNALARLYPVPRGTIFIDGRDLLDIPESTLRRIVAMAPQDSFLFSTTLRDNLLYGRPNAGDDAARRVADLASFLEEVDQFPDG